MATHFRDLLHNKVEFCGHSRFDATAFGCTTRAPTSDTLTYFRLYPDEAGVSHFEPFDIEVFSRAFAPPAAPFSVSALVPASPRDDKHPAEGATNNAFELIRVT